MTAKLRNGIEYSNQNFPTEFGEYLLKNGFSCRVEKQTLRFSNSRHQLIVRFDTLDLYTFYPEVTIPENRLCHEQTHSGISHLTFFCWILLMHAMGVVRVPDYMKNSVMEGLQEETEAEFIIQNLLETALTNQNI